MAVRPSAKIARTEASVCSMRSSRAANVIGMPASCAASRSTRCRMPRRTTTLPRSGSRAGPFGTAPSSLPVLDHMTMLR